MSADNTDNTGNNCTRKRRMEDCEVPSASKKPKLDDGDLDDDTHPYGPRLMTRKMYARLFTVVEELPLRERRDWMRILFDMVESHQGCLSNDKHWYFSDEDPGMYNTFKESLRTGDLEKFKTLKCFQFSESDF